MTKNTHAILLEYIQSEIISNEITSKIATSDDLLSTGIIDSLSIMRLIAFIEERFDQKVPPQDLVIENFISIDAMATYILQNPPSPK
ncbi:MAG: acyl carrier protein [Saprospiraceae bacterium]|nr:acyl carrier protein [Saprospiraceae bacterium]